MKVFFLVLLAGLVMLPVLTTLEANLSSRYGYRVSNVQYRTSLPIGARAVYVNNQRLYLANNVYYKPYIYNGRTIYVPVDRTWLYQQQGMN